MMDTLDTQDKECDILQLNTIMESDQPALVKLHILSQRNVADWMNAQSLLRQQTHRDFANICVFVKIELIHQ